MTQRLSLYRRIAHDLHEKIRRGQYTPGQKIPTIRQLAVEYGCNKITVQKAFDDLSRLGVIENKVGSGSYVRFPLPSQSDRRTFRFSQRLCGRDAFPLPAAANHHP